MNERQKRFLMRQVDAVREANTYAEKLLYLGGLLMATNWIESTLDAADPCLIEIRGQALQLAAAMAA